MKQYLNNGGFPAGNPIANIFVVIVGALAIGGFVVLGFFALMIVGSIVAVMAAVIGIRVWWFKRKLRGQMQSGQSSDPGTGATAGGVIEGEYKVVAEDREDA